MVYYRITIRPRGPLSTPWISGTLWGHIAWAIRYMDGESSLAAWLKDQETLPWLFSSFMPEGMVPRPLLPPSLRKGEKHSFENFEKDKTAKQVAYIPETVFLAQRTGLNEKILVDAISQAPLAGSGWMKEHPLFHNRIDRRTGRTPESGGLFVENASWPETGHRFQVFAAANQDCLERFEHLLSFIARSGFGANASTGKGAFDFDIAEEKQLFAGTGNRAMSLSHGIITPEMKNPRYRLHTHYGKLGGHFAAGACSPFKYPVLMARPGATFDPAGDPPFGKLLANVHHDESLGFIRHHAFHLPIYFTEVTS